MTRLYLAGPMTGIEDLNFPLFHAETARLRALGIDIVNPAEINVDPTKGWAECMKADIAQLVTCDGVALLPGWEASRGAKIERYLAASLGMQVHLAANLGREPLETVQAVPRVDWAAA